MWLDRAKHLGRGAEIEVGTGSAPTKAGFPAARAGRANLTPSGSPGAGRVPRRAGGGFVDVRLPEGQTLAGSTLRLVGESLETGEGTRVRVAVLIRKNATGGM